jgi:hypothetical protein
MDLIFIAISGKKQHGKNYFARRLRTLLNAEGISVTETAFATPIKNFCHDVFGISHEDMESEEGKQKLTHLRWCDLQKDISFENYHRGSYFTDGKAGRKPSFEWIPYDEYLTIRELLQVIGTDLFRDKFYGPIWAEAPFRKKYLQKIIDQDGPYIEEYKSPYNVVLITDCRFPNEVAQAQLNKAFIVRVHRTDAPDSGDAHSSETALDDWTWGKDQLIENNGHPECFDSYIKTVLIPKIKGRLYGNQ